MNDRFYSLTMGLIEKYCILEDENIWKQIKDIIISTGEFIVKDWYLELDGPSIKFEDEKLIMKGASKLIPRLPWTE